MTSPSPNPPRQPATEDAARRARFMGGLVPPPVSGSPVDLPDQPRSALQPDFATMFDGPVPWWRPGVWDVVRSIGWWWMLLLPMVLLLVGVIVAAFLYQHLWPMIFSWAKVWLAIVAGMISIVLYGVRNVVKNRKDPFCIHCGYSLQGLAPSGTCPECGRPYLLSLVEEYRKDPHFFVERYKSARQLPSRVTAFVAGDGPTPDDGTR